MQWNPVLVKKLLKSKIYRFVNSKKSTSQQVRALKKKKKKREKRGRSKTGRDKLIQTHI